MPILCVGLSHHTAPLALRERLHYSSPALCATLARLGCGNDSRPNQLSELAILSTCNRLEVYAVSVEPANVQTLIELLAETTGVQPDEFESHLFHYAGLDAVAHLCSVACGLDSLILGEPQILGQVAEAFETAFRQRAAGPELSALFRTAIRAGKRARTETGISRNPASISSVAVHLAEQVVGPLAERRVLVVGAGEMGELAVEALRSRNVHQITVVNRTRQRAVELAERWGGQALSFEQLGDALRAADIVIASTGAPHLIIDAQMVRDSQAGRSRPLALIDIAVPRDVDPAVTSIPGVHLFDIDQLQSQLEGAVTERQQEVPRVEAIVAQEVKAFDQWLRTMEMTPIITDLRAKAERIRQGELDRTLRRMPDLDPRTRDQIEHLSRLLVNKILHEPTLRLKAEAGSGRTAEYAQTVRHLFGLTAEESALTGGPQA
jgi:glutamyl-tRNA reductase